MVLQDLQVLGHLRGDIHRAVRSRDEFPFVWLLTHDSKASAFTQLLFVQEPW